MKKLIITLIVLVALTIITAIISWGNVSYTLVVILMLATLKFIGVLFYFMELRNAHIFWKGSVLTFVMLFFIIILLAF